jgi:hypothetical protein
LLGEVVGGGTYDALLAHTEIRELFGRHCRFVDLPTLVRLKRAAGRPKDLERIAELEAAGAFDRFRPPLMNACARPGAALSGSRPATVTSTAGI